MEGKQKTIPCSPSTTTPWLLVRVINLVIQTSYKQHSITVQSFNIYYNLFLTISYYTNITIVLIKLFCFYPSNLPRRTHLSQTAFSCICKSCLPYGSNVYFQTHAFFLNQISVLIHMRKVASFNKYLKTVWDGTVADRTPNFTSFLRLTWKKKRCTLVNLSKSINIICTSSQSKRRKLRKYGYGFHTQETKQSMRSFPPYFLEIRLEILNGIENLFSPNVCHDRHSC